jgi:hypothetical protein
MRNHFKKIWMLQGRRFKILYVTRFWVNWAFLIALEALKPSLRSCFNLVPRAIRKAQFTQKLVA